MKTNRLLLLLLILLPSCADVLPQEELVRFPDGFVSPLERIFVVNLDRSPDRLLAVQKQFERTSLNFERFAAIEGKKYQTAYRQRVPTDNIIQFLDPSQNYTYKFDSYRREKGLVPGEIGCFLSHYEILKKIASENIGVAMVLEDDIVLPKDFELRLTSILAHAPDSWDIIYLYHNYGVGLCRGSFPLTENQRFLDLTNSGCITGTVGYLVNQQGAQKIVKNIMPMSTTIDAQISEEFFAQKHGPFRAYAAYPQVLSLGGFSATIENRAE